MKTIKKDFNCAEKDYLKAFYKKNMLQFYLGLVFSLLGIPINLVLSWMLGAVLDTVVEKNLEQLVHLLIAGLVLAIVAGGVGIALARSKAIFIHRGLKQYKEYAFSKLSQKSISAFVSENTGRYLSILTNDISTLEEKYLNKLFDIVYLTIQFVATVCFMLWYSPVMTVATVLLCALPIAGTMLFSKEMSRREKSVSDGSELFVGRLKDLLSGFAVLKSFKVEKEACELFNQSNKEIENLKMRRRMWQGLMMAVNWNFFGPMMQFGIFFIGAYLAIRGSIKLGTTIVFVQVCNYLLQFVQSVPQSLSERKAAKGLIRKLAEVTEENASRSGEAVEPVLNDSITLDNVTFGYDAGTPVLKNISLKLEAGKKYALVGSSGSGKTTLMNLLMGAYDSYSGSITFDNKELKTICTDNLYDIISLIGQNVFLFDDTIRCNITMFRDFSAEKVQSAVKRAGLTELISSRGEDYRCGENGSGLSGGEKQRISIARALLRGTPVLLLDEATASLDNQTAFTITDSILHLDGLTRLVVTHRLEAGLLEQYDEIFVLKDGILRERGKFDELMDEKGYFYSLYTVTQ